MYTAFKCGRLTAGPDGDRGSSSHHSDALLRAMTTRSVSIPVPDRLPSRHIALSDGERVRAGRY
jgi:hypothetical protein